MKKNKNFSGLSEIGQIAVTVHDLNSAEKFYREKLGMKFMYRFPNLVFFDCGGVRLMLGLPENPEQDHPGSIIYFKVQDLIEAYSHFKKNLVEIIQEPQQVAKTGSVIIKMMFIKDPDNNPIGVYSETKK
jgi:predicted enzyme related to lactoylglutathione lyase